MLRKLFEKALSNQEMISLVLTQIPRSVREWTVDVMKYVVWLRNESLFTVSLCARHISRQKHSEDYIFASGFVNVCCSTDIKYLDTYMV